MIDKFKRSSCPPPQSLAQTSHSPSSPGRRICSSWRSVRLPSWSTSLGIASSESGMKELVRQHSCMRCQRNSADIRQYSGHCPLSSQQQRLSSPHHPRPIPNSSSPPSPIRQVTLTARRGYSDFSSLLCPSSALTLWLI